MDFAIKKKYDLHAWNTVIDSVLQQGDTEQIKLVFKKVTELMPDQECFYLKWLQYEQAKGDTEAMEQIFKDILPVSYSVSLWNFYLGYVVQAQAQAPEVIQSAYEFALSQIGNDLESGGIWLDYIGFVKDGFTASTFEEQQKMETIRKLYQRAVKVPLSNIENIWKDYDTFENNLNKTTVNANVNSYRRKSLFRILQGHI
jgi:cleavage stimulation factor subunit 3